MVPDAMAATPEVDEALKAKEAKEVLNLEGADNPQNWSHAKKVGVLQRAGKSRDLGVHIENATDHQQLRAGSSDIVSRPLARHLYPRSVLIASQCSHIFIVNTGPFARWDHRAVRSIA